MEKINSVIWLIIFLCLILLGVEFIWGYGKYTAKTSALITENEILKQQISSLEKEKQLILDKTEVIASSSALPKIKKE